MRFNALMRQWIGGLVVLVTLMWMCSLLVGFRMEKVVKENSFRLPDTSSAIYQDLQLTEVQRKTISVQEKEYTRQVRTFCERHCSARMKISKMLESGQLDAAQLTILCDEAGAAHAGAEKATLQHLLKVSELLTPEQKALYLKKFSTQIEATCPREFFK